MPRPSLLLGALAALSFVVAGCGRERVAEAPALAFFRGTPAFALVEAIGRIVPLFAPRLVLSDPEPRMGRVAWEGPRAD